MLNKEKYVPQETDSFCLSLNILLCIYKQLCDSLTTITLLGALNSSQVIWQIQRVVPGEIANTIEVLSSWVWELGFLLLYLSKQTKK